MTDRHEGYIVVLEHGIREDDAKDTINALKMVKGVLTVEPVLGAVSIQIATVRVREELKSLLWNALWGVLKDRR